MSTKTIEELNGWVDVGLDEDGDLSIGTVNVEFCFNREQAVILLQTIKEILDV
jgi:hypothetical protein